MLASLSNACERFYHKIHGIYCKKWMNVIYLFIYYLQNSTKTILEACL
mgnify:CR=1 FL=1